MNSVVEKYLGDIVSSMNQVMKEHPNKIEAKEIIDVLVVTFLKKNSDNSELAI